MRRKGRLLIYILVLALLTAGLSSCGKKSETKQEETQAQTKPDTSTTGQLALIAENSDIWIARGGDGAIPYYAVTDLDQNGRLEIFSSLIEGTGNFTTTLAWEVGDTYDYLKRIDLSAFDDMSEPDISDHDYMRCYFTDDGRISYVTEDVIRDGYAHITFVKGGISLENGRLAYTPLGSIDSFAEQRKDGHTDVYAGYYDREGNNVTSLEFSAIENDVYGGTLQRATVASFGWFTTQEGADLTAMLRKSWQTFGYDDSYSDVANLFFGPKDYYEGYDIKDIDEAGADGQDEEDLFADYPGFVKMLGEWMAEIIEVEGSRDHAVELGIGCWLTFREDMTCDFLFKLPEGSEPVMPRLEEEQDGEPETEPDAELTEEGAQEPEDEAPEASQGSAEETGLVEDGSEEVPQEPEVPEEPDDGNRDFRNMHFEFRKGAMYKGCPNQDWYVVFSADGGNTFKATLSDQFTVELIWRVGDDTSDGLSAICYMQFVSNY